MVVLPLFLLFAVNSGCEDGLKTAFDALRHNNASGAVSLLESIRTNCTGSSSFYDLLGVANELSGNSEAAENALREAVALSPKSPQLLADLGAAYLRNKKPKEAAAALSQAFALDPGNRTTATYLIGAYVESAEWRLAADLFRRMGVPNDASLLKEPTVAMWFARTFIEIREPDQIDTAFRAGREAMPPALLFSLGTLLAQHGLYAKAIDYLQLIPPEKADDAVYFNLGLACSHLQRFESARRYYFQVIDAKPEHVEAYFRVGLDYAAAGDPRRAIPWLARAHDWAMARPDIAYALAEQLIQLEYFDSAKEVLTQALTLNPRNALLLVANADRKLASGSAGEALKDYEQVLTEVPGMPPALIGRARVYSSEGKAADAQTCLRDALSSDPENAAALGELGLLEAQQGQWTSAFQHLNRAWSQDRSNTNVALQLGRVLLHLDRPDEAVQLLNSLPPAARGSSAFHLELAQLYTKLHKTSEAQAEREALQKLELQNSEGLHFDNPKNYVY